MKRPISISFYTLGCRLNQSETAVLQNLFEQQGYLVLRFGEPTDIVVINTCTVTKNSETDTRKMVQRVVRKHPKTLIALVGCQAQLQSQELTQLPNVRWVIGTAKKMDLVGIFKNNLAPVQPQVIVPTIQRQTFTVPVAGIDRQHVRANLKIQDGCDAFCAFCEIPYARGRARSRLFSDIITEAKALSAAGHQEIVLTGINIGHYQDSGKTLYDVVSALEETPLLSRIRISSIEPTTINPRLLKRMFPRGKLCRHLHIPLQSASNKILKLMRRPYTIEEFDHFLDLAVTSVPDICIGSDVLVGFPGEGEADFELTRDFLRKRPVHHCHIFSYSERRLARSRQLPQKIQAPVIKSRSALLRDIANQNRDRFYESMLGQNTNVLFEQNKGEAWHGLTDNFLHVFAIASENLQNQIVPVRLLSLEKKEIRAELSRSQP